MAETPKGLPFLLASDPKNAPAPEPAAGSTVPQQIIEGPYPRSAFYLSQAVSDIFAAGLLAPLEDEGEKPVLMQHCRISLRGVQDWQPFQIIFSSSEIGSEDGETRSHCQAVVEEQIECFFDMVKDDPSGIEVIIEEGYRALVFSSPGELLAFVEKMIAGFEVPLIDNPYPDMKVFGRNAKTALKKRAEYFKELIGLTGAMLEHNNEGEDAGTIPREYFLSLPPGSYSKESLCWMLGTEVVMTGNNIPIVNLEFLHAVVSQELAGVSTLPYLDPHMNLH